MCVFSMFFLYMLVMVGIRATVTHDRYIHDSCHGMRRRWPHLIRGSSSI